ncbi:HAD family hydrolase, partial [Geomesophilobacter sediminis]
MGKEVRIDWNEIDTVLLDMDGTILDRHFDDHFWLEHVPKRYAEKAGISHDAAKEKLYRLFHSQENTLNWTDLDYWSAQLDLDIPLLKRELRHLIAVHPSVTDFLLFLERHGKGAYLVTNAHFKTLDLKLATVPIAQHFAGIFSAHEIGLPKEDPAFWKKLQERIPYAPSVVRLAFCFKKVVQYSHFFLDVCV